MNLILILLLISALAKDSVCNAKKGIGEPCTENKECNGNLFCHKPPRRSMTCGPKRNISDRCWDNAECGEGAYCNQYFDHRTCSLGKGPMQNCTKDAECQERYYCHDEKKTCSFKLEENSPCTEDRQCLGNLTCQPITKRRSPFTPFLIMTDYNCHCIGGDAFAVSAYCSVMDIKNERCRFCINPKDVVDYNGTYTSDKPKPVATTPVPEITTLDKPKQVPTTPDPDTNLDGDTEEPSDESTDESTEDPHMYNCSAKFQSLCEGYYLIAKNLTQNLPLANAALVVGCKRYMDDTELDGLQATFADWASKSLPTIRRKVLPDADCAIVLRCACELYRDRLEKDIDNSTMTSTEKIGAKNVLTDICGAKKDD